MSRKISKQRNYRSAFFAVFFAELQLTTFSHFFIVIFTLEEFILITNLNQSYNTQNTVQLLKNVFFK